jgi:hypothetical protein
LAARTAAAYPARVIDSHMREAQMTVRGFLSWYLGSIAFIGAAGAAGYHILARQNSDIGTVMASAPAIEPAQSATVAAAEPAPAPPRPAPVPSMSPGPSPPAPSPPGMSAAEALALLPPAPSSAETSQALPPLRRHVTQPARHVVRRRLRAPQVANRATSLAAAPVAAPSPPRVIYYYAYPPTYPYAAGYRYAYYPRYGYYRAF